MADVTALCGESLAKAGEALAAFFGCPALARFPEGTAFLLEKDGALFYLARLRLPEVGSGVVTLRGDAAFAPLPIVLSPAEPLPEARRRAENLTASTAPRAAANGFSVFGVLDPLALEAFRFDLAARKLALLGGETEYRAALENRDRLRAAAFDPDASFVPACILLEGGANA